MLQNDSLKGTLTQSNNAYVDLAVNWRYIENNSDTENELKAEAYVNVEILEERRENHISANSTVKKKKKKPKKRFVEEFP